MSLSARFNEHRCSIVSQYGRCNEATTTIVWVDGKGAVVMCDHHAESYGNWRDDQ